MKKPYLKWPGNKIRAMETLLKHLPTGQRLVEPFVGSGAVFLNTDYDSYLLADANKHLVWAHRLIGGAMPTGLDDIIEMLRFIYEDSNNAESFYDNRLMLNANEGTERLSALTFIYLNRHCFNGLVRYNAKGEFNAPFGRYKDPYLPEEEMRNFHRKWQDVQPMINCRDFRLTMALADPGDTIYADPPYLPLSTTANFSSYSAGGFSYQDQVDLRDCAVAAAQRGIPVVISNHDTSVARELYADAEIVAFEVSRSISCKGDGRGKAPELLAIYKPN